MNNLNQLNQYRNYLKILEIFHYVIAGLYGLTTITGIFSILAMNTMLENMNLPPEQLEQQRQALEAMKPMLIASSIGGIILAIAIIFSGLMIHKRKYYWFSVVIAAIMSVYFYGLGTILGIFTIIVLVQKVTKTIYFGSNEDLLIEEIQTEPYINQELNSQFDTDATGGIIPYKNPKALISYYLGIFSIIPVIGIILGIIALILGIQGFKDYHKNPHIRGRFHASIGIGCGSIFALLWLLVSIIIITAIFTK